MTQQRMAVRLLAEGAVIIVSILLAFWIDAAWAGRMAAREEQDALAALHDEAIANRAILADVIGRVERDYASARAFFEMAVDESSAAPVEVADPALQSLWRPNTYSLKTGALGGLTSSGRLNLLRDAGLRELLANWQSQATDLAERHQNLAGLEVEVLKALGRHPDVQAWLMTRAGQSRPSSAATGASELTPPPGSLVSFDLRSIREDREAMAPAAAMQFQRQVYLMVLTQLASQLDLVVEALEVARH